MTDSNETLGNAAASPLGADARLVERLRAGDEDAFLDLVRRYNGPLTRLAMVYVGNGGQAEEVVQDTWLGLIQGLDRFEARSSLKTWLFSILVNRAKTRGERERRIVPFSSLADADDDGDEPTVEADRFLPDDHERYPGHWLNPPAAWDNPEERLVSAELMDQLRAAVDQLPETQRLVLTLRDIEGFGSEEVCNLLGIRETNQRVLLHRARAKVRRGLESYFAGA